MKTKHTSSRPRLALAAGLALAFATAHAADFTSTWDGTAGNWSNTAKWSTPGASGTFPNNGGSTYDAAQSAGTITLDQNISIQNFTLSGGGVTGTNNLTLNGALNWSGDGTMSGTGTTNALGGISFSGGATKVLTGGRTLNNGDGVNAVTASWTAGTMIFNNSATFNNKANATFTTDFNGSLIDNGSNSAAFNNSGTVTKSGGSGTTSFALAFNNSGTVNANSGTLSLDGGGTSSGVFNVAAGKTLQFGGGTQTLTGASQVTGAGNISFTGGTTNVNGDYALTGAISATGGVGNILAVTGTATSVTVGASGTLNINGGTLTAGSMNLDGVQGGTGTLTVSGALNWSGGGIMSGTGVTNANGGLTMNNAFLLTNHTLNNGDGVNAATANWTAGNMIFNNGGTFNNKANATFTTNFNGSIADNGSNSASINNAGTMTKSAGSGTTSFGLTFNNSGTINADSGTLSFEKLNMTAGTLTGSATANATTLNWTGGTLSGSGSTTVTGGTITTTGVKGLDRTLNNTGTINFTGTSGSGGQIQFGVGTSTPGVINNSGTFNLASGASFQISNANAGHAINNSGTWNVSGGGSNNTINTGIKFNNSGAVTVTGNSTFVTNGGGTQTGSFSVAGGSDLWLISSDLNSGSSVTGAGTVTLGGTTINTGSTYNTSGSTILRGGITTFNTSATTGTLTKGASSTLDVSGASTTLTVNGAFTQSAGDTVLVGGALIDATVFNLNGGALRGTGTIDSSVITSGTNLIAPGQSPGTLTINGDLTLNSGSTLAMEIGGLTQGALYDYLNVNGVITLAGLLNLDLINGFGNSVSHSDHFTLATANSGILGSFANVASGNRYTLADGESFAVFYGAGSAYGANNLVAGDYLNVPEPSRALLILVGMLGITQRRRRKTA